MVATKGPEPHTTMYTVCKIMEGIWDLPVLCPCRDKNPDLVCHGAYMSTTVRCMGVSICVSPACTIAHAHPNALDDIWHLKHGAPLQSFWATTSRRTTNVFLSALSNTLPFLASWGSFLLSVTAWNAAGHPITIPTDTQCSPCAHLPQQPCTVSWPRRNGTSLFRLGG